MLWPFVYQAFADSQGYTTERQQEWVKSCKDHHRSWDEVSRFLDSTFDQLLYPYVLDSEEPSPDGFYRWAEQYSSNKTFTHLLNLSTRLFGLMVYRFGIRHNQLVYRVLGRRLLSPLLFARNHPRYQLIELWDELDALRYPPELGRLFCRYSSFSRFVVTLLPF